MVAVVTGAASGLGKAIAESFARRGLAVGLLDWNAEGLEAFAGTLAGGKAPVAAARVDVSDEASVTQAFRQVREKLGPVSVLVNAAGIADMQSALEMPLAAWNRTIAINLSGVFYCCRAAVEDMKASGFGRIVNLASASGTIASFGRIAYGTSKAGVVHLTRQLAVEWAAYGITVNAISPGPIESPMSASLGPATRAAYLARIPVKRYGVAQDITNAVEYLVSEGASYVTGLDLAVDGGLTVLGLTAMPD